MDHSRKVYCHSFICVLKIKDLDVRGGDANAKRFAQKMRIERGARRLSAKCSKSGAIIRTSSGYAIILVIAGPHVPREVNVGNVMRLDELSLAPHQTISAVDVVSLSLVARVP